MAKLYPTMQKMTSEHWFCILCVYASSPFEDTCISIPENILAIHCLYINLMR